MKKRSALFAIMVAIAMGLTPNIGWGAIEKTAVTLAAGDIKGTLSDATGKPLVGVTVALRRDGKVLMTAVSDKTGQFTLQKVKAGHYELLTPGMNPLPLRASTRSGVTTLKLVMPIRKTYAAAGPSFSGLYEWVITSFETAPVTAGLVTAGVVAAVAVPIAVNNSGSSGSDTVSP